MRQRGDAGGAAQGGVGWRQRSFAARLPGREIRGPVLPCGDAAFPRREAAAATVRPGPEDALRARGALWVPGRSRGRRPQPSVSAQPLLETRERATWEERPESPPGAAQVREQRWGAGDAKGEGCGWEAGRAAGAPPPGGAHPAAPNLENKGSGKHGRGRRAEVEGRGKAGGGGRAGARLHFLSAPPALAGAAPQSGWARLPYRRAVLAPLLPARPHPLRGPPLGSPGAGEPRGSSAPCRCRAPPQPGAS